MAKTTPLAIIYLRKALRRARDLPAGQLKTLETVLDGLAADPTYLHNNLKPLSGSKDAFRLRLGGWRVTFAIDADARTLTCIDIQPRGSAYK